MTKYLLIQLKGEDPKHELASYHEVNGFDFHFSFDVPTVPKEFKLKTVSVQTVSQGQVVKT